MMLTILTLLVAQAYAATVPLSRLSNYPNAKCMDGTSGGYFFQRGSRATDWIINLEGGGECTDKASCYPRLFTSLGSAKHFPSEMSFDSEKLWLLDSNEDRNPIFSDFNLVYIKYCTSDLWQGTSNGKTSLPYNFNGKYIVDAVLDDLDTTANLTSATNIILTGESAGGIGVWPHLTALEKRYGDARVVGAPIAGFYFFAYPLPGAPAPSASLSDFREAAWPQHYNLWKASVDENCQMALPSEPWKCCLANYSYPYLSKTMKRNIFVTEAQTDAVVLKYHDWIPEPSTSEPHWNASVTSYVETWKNNMSSSLQATGFPYFSPACFIHTSFSSSKPLIQNTSFTSAFREWWTSGHTHRFSDTCGIMCNPTC
eukprot:g366.t1